tara:strand:- start:44 stop:547 length:504 start_codon:yes stop_codon:yes gene_type:complete
VNKEPNYQVHDCQQGSVVRVQKKASYLNCEPVRNFFEQRLHAGQKNFIVDFANCTSVDSTFLGILVGLALKLRKIEDPGKLVLVNLLGRNLETVQNLGIHRIAEISEMKIETESDLQMLDSTRGDNMASSKAIYDAHKMLMNLNSKNSRMFCDVVNFLEQELVKGKK